MTTCDNSMMSLILQVLILGDEAEERQDLGLPSPLSTLLGSILQEERQELGLLSPLSSLLGSIFQEERQDLGPLTPLSTLLGFVFPEERQSFGPLTPLSNLLGSIFLFAIRSLSFAFDIGGFIARLLGFAAFTSRW